jgi:hypothetical protein
MARVAVYPSLLVGSVVAALALFRAGWSPPLVVAVVNVAIAIGALDWLLSTADLHRWHHSIDAAESNANYGANLIVWDVLSSVRAARWPARVPRCWGSGATTRAPSSGSSPHRSAALRIEGASRFGMASFVWHAKATDCIFMQATWIITSPSRELIAA